MTTEHPLITAMRTAGEQTQRIAASLLRDYPHTGGAMLADALIEDQTGHSAINDNWRIRDRDGSVESRRAANERKTQRMNIAIAFDRQTPENRDAICRALAAGNGAQMADDIIATTGAMADVLIATVNTMALESAAVAS